MITDQVYNDWKNWNLRQEDNSNKVVLENLIETINQYLESPNSHVAHSVLVSGLECTFRWFTEN